MSYYIIGGEPVFITHLRRSNLNERALRGKPPEWRVASDIAGMPQSQQADELRYFELEKEYLKDPASFRNQWVKFDMTGDEAQLNVWDLLFDYCHLHKSGRLVDLREEDEKVLADYVDDSYHFPMGRLFAVEFEVRQTSPWWSLIKRIPSPYLRIAVDTNRVKGLQGTLIDFMLLSPTFLIRFANTVTLMPIGSPETALHPTAQPRDR